MKIGGSKFREGISARLGLSWNVGDWVAVVCGNFLIGGVEIARFGVVEVVIASVVEAMAVSGKVVCSEVSNNVVVNAIVVEVVVVVLLLDVE